MTLSMISSFEWLVYPTFCLLIGWQKVERNLFTYTNLHPFLTSNNWSLHTVLLFFLAGITQSRKHGCVLQKGKDERKLSERQIEGERAGHWTRPYLVFNLYFLLHNSSSLSLPSSKGQTWHAFNCDLSNQSSTKVLSSLQHLAVHLTGTASRHGPNSQMRGENILVQTSELIRE
jgi:hypothetical protein